MHSSVLAGRSQGHAIAENKCSGKTNNIDKNPPTGDFAMPVCRARPDLDFHLDIRMTSITF